MQQGRREQAFSVCVMQYYLDHNRLIISTLLSPIFIYIGLYLYTYIRAQGADMQADCYPHRNRLQRQWTAITANAVTATVAHHCGEHHTYTNISQPPKSSNANNLQPYTEVTQWLSIRYPLRRECCAHNKGKEAAPIADLTNEAFTKKGKQLQHEVSNTPKLKITQRRIVIKNLQAVHLFEDAAN